MFSKRLRRLFLVVPVALSFILGSAALMCLVANVHYVRREILEDALKENSDLSFARDRLSERFEETLEIVDRLAVDDFFSTRERDSVLREFSVVPDAAGSFRQGEASFAAAVEFNREGNSPEEEDEILRVMFAFAERILPPDLCGGRTLDLGKSRENEYFWGSPSPLFADVFDVYVPTRKDVFKKFKKTLSDERKSARELMEVSFSDPLEITYDTHRNSFQAVMFQNKIFLFRGISSEKVKGGVQFFLLNENRFGDYLKAGLPEEMNIVLSFGKDGDPSDMTPARLDFFVSKEKKAAGGKFVFFALVSAAVFLGILGLDVGIFMISKKLADSAKHQRIFADAIAHDLKTPAIEAESMANLLALRIGDDSLRPHVMALQKKLGRLTKMLDDILIFSEISACDQIRLPLERRVFGEIVDPVVESILERFSRNGCDFEVVLSRSARSASVLVSVSAFERILFNLSDNALKYARKKEGDCVLTFEASVGGGFLQISVRDNGEGIPLEIAKKLFRENPRESRGAPKAGKSGLGIGLLLSKKLAKAMGGDLTLTENGLTGATFLLSLPMSK